MPSVLYAIFTLPKYPFQHLYSLIDLPPLQCSGISLIFIGIYVVIRLVIFSMKHFLNPRLRSITTKFSIKIISFHFIRNCQHYSKYFIKLRMKWVFK